MMRWLFCICMSVVFSVLTVVAVNGSVRASEFTKYDRETLTKLLLTNKIDSSKRFTTKNVGEYVDVLLFFQERGEVLNRYFVERLSFEMARNKQWLAAYAFARSLPGVNIQIDTISDTCAAHERFIPLMKELYARASGEVSTGSSGGGSGATRENGLKRLNFLLHYLCFDYEQREVSRRPPIDSVTLSAFIDNILTLLERTTISAEQIHGMLQSQLKNKDHIRAWVVLYEYAGNDALNEMISYDENKRFTAIDATRAVSFMRKHGIAPIHAKNITKLFREQGDRVTPMYLSALAELYARKVTLPASYYNYNKMPHSLFLSFFPNIVHADFREVLYRLNDIGIATSEMAQELSLEKARNREFVDALIEMRQRLTNDKIVDAFFARTMDIARLTSAKYRDIIARAVMRDGDTCAHSSYVCKKNVDDEYMNMYYPDISKKLSIMFSHKGVNDWGDVFLRVTGVEWARELNRVLSFREETADPIVHEIIDRALSYSREEIVKKMNSLHERPDSERLAVVLGATPRTLYYLIATSDELYTSTLNLLAQKFKETLVAEHTTFMAFVRGHDAKHELLSEFIFTLARFGKLSSVLEGVHERDVGMLFTAAIERLEKAKDPLQHAFYLSAGIGDMLGGAARGKSALSDILERALFAQREKFVAEKKDTQAVLLDIVISLYAESFSKQYQERARAFRSIHGVDSGERVTPVDLIDRSGVMHSVMLFYNDADGHASYGNFLAERVNSGWRIEDNGEFVIVSKQSAAKTSAVKSIRVYANKPDKSQYDLWSYLKKNNIQQTLLAHRGHSYYTRSTLYNLTGKEAMVFLGSCGGFKETGNIVEKNMNVMVFGSRNIGTMQVNDPLLNLIDLQLLAGETNLRKIWEYAMNKISDSRKSDYVAPYENVGPKIYRAYALYQKQNEQKQIADR